MKRFIFSSPKFNGSAVFEFNLQGLLCLMKIEGSISEEQHRWILDNAPIRIEKLTTYKTIKGAQLLEEKVEITFEMFYEKYGYKRDKKKAITCWNRMKEADRIAAYYYIQTYLTTLKPGISIKLPVSYLRSEIWND